MLPLQHLRLRSAFIPSFSVLSALLANRPGHIGHVTDGKAAMGGPGGGRLFGQRRRGFHKRLAVTTHQHREKEAGDPGSARAGPGGLGGWGRGSEGCGRGVLEARLCL